MKDLPIIQCPVCGRQMLLGEVYMPNDFFGYQKEVIRKPSGEIDFYVGTDPNMDEEYVCDNCGTNLSIHATVNFNVSVSEEEQEFDENYVTKIDKPKKLILEEADIFNK